MALEKSFRLLRGNSGSKSLWYFFITVLPGEIEKHAVFPAECRPETESNLWSNVFEREYARVGIMSDALNSSRARIKALVDRRNAIAHGKNMTIKSVGEYVEYENTTLLVLHDQAVQV